MTFHKVNNNGGRGGVSLVNVASCRLADVDQRNVSWGQYCWFGLQVLSFKVQVLRFKCSTLGKVKG